MKFYKVTYLSLMVFLLASFISRTINAINGLDAGKVKSTVLVPPKANNKSFIPSTNKNLAVLRFSAYRS